MKRLILLPTYNEMENLSKFIPSLNEICQPLQIDLLFIDDNSPDGSGDFLERKRAQYPWIHVIHNGKKSGLGRAYLQGMNWALTHGYEEVLQMDSDFSHPLEKIPEMFSNLQKFDVVVGSRYVPGGRTENWSWRRRVLSLGGSWYARLILGLKIHDLTAGFNAWRASVLQRILRIPPTSEGYSFQIELKLRASRAGFKIHEIPILFREREGGKSKMSFRVILEAVLVVWKWRWTQAQIPLRDEGHELR